MKAYKRGETKEQIYKMFESTLKRINMNKKSFRIENEKSERKINV